MVKGRDGRIGFSQEDRCKILKKRIERILNEKNARDHKVDAAMIEVPVEKSFSQGSERSNCDGGIVFNVL